MLTDIEIAQNAIIKPITKIAESIGIKEESLELYGQYKAKVKSSSPDGSNPFRNDCRRNGRFVAVPGSRIRNIVRHSSCAANGQRAIGDCPCKVARSAALGKSPKGYK